MNQTGNGLCNQNPCGNVTIVQGMSGSFYVDLFYQDTKEPFDLSNASEIIASFPAPNSGVVQEKLTLSQIAIVGANGAGKISIAYTALDSSLMQIDPNTQQFQDLQVIVTKSGVAQINTISSGAPTAGTQYTVTLNGIPFTYAAVAGDTVQIVMAQLQKLILASTTIPLTVVATLGMSLDTLILTALYPGLGFNCSVSAALTNTASTPSSGTRSTFILQATLNIEPPSYTGS